MEPNPASQPPGESEYGRPASGWQLRLYIIIFEADTRLGRLFDLTLIWIILASVAVVLLDSMASVHAKYADVLVALEWGFTIIFSVEYIARLACVRHPARYARSFYLIIDLLAVLPTYLAVLVPGLHALIDVRVLSATHRDLEALLADGSFRQDLFYRLNVVTLRLPTLAERREDIPLLAQHFLSGIAARQGRPLNGFAPDALRALSAAAWPGNVRQLHNVVEQVCALSTTPLVPLALVQRALRTTGVDVLSYAEARRRFEREYLVGLLKLTDGNVADAARLAERNRTEFYRLLQKHDLGPERWRDLSPNGDSDKSPA